MSLSGGHRQKAAIARMFLRDPSVFSLMNPRPAWTPSAPTFPGRRGRLKKGPPAVRREIGGGFQVRKIPAKKARPGRMDGLFRPAAALHNDQKAAEAV